MKFLGKKFLLVINLIFIINILVNSNLLAYNIKKSSSNYDNQQFLPYLTLVNKAKYSDDFLHFDYTNPYATKAGEVVFGIEGNFNSLNPFIIKGLSAAGISYLYDSLAIASDDEYGVYYGLIASGIKYRRKENFIEFKLNKMAKFHDGSKLNADDVIFSFEKLKTDGHPSYKIALKQIIKILKINDYHIKFILAKKHSKDLAARICTIKILPKNFYQKYNFSDSNLGDRNIMPLGSGPYIIEKVDFGKTISYKRVKNYWAKDLAVNVGMYNFDRITFDYYRDNNSLIEAFKSQNYDFRQENIARNWANAYNIKAVNNGEIIKKEVINNNPAPIQTFVFNLRNSKFQDLALRKAINLAFDFEWANHHLFYDSYIRTNSFFENSQFSYIKNQDKIEKIDKIKQQKNLANNYQDSPLSRRDRLLKAQKILLDAGYKIVNNHLYHKNDINYQQPIIVEFLVDSPVFNMVLNSFTNNLKRIGIDAKIKLVEENQYQTLVRNFKFDIIITSFMQAMLPGEELFFYLHSSQKNVIGTRNYAGIDDKNIDLLVEKIRENDNIEELKILTAKLDKYIIDQQLFIFHWYNNKDRIIYRNIFEMPKISPQYGINIDSWWLKIPLN